MFRMKRLHAQARCVLLATLFALASASAALACTWPDLPKSKLDPDLYVFIGEVVGYTDSIKSKSVIGKAFGLKVKVLDVVNIPGEARDTFEVFPYDQTGNCKSIGYSVSKVMGDFPIGSTVRVIARKAMKIRASVISRLEVEGLLSISRNDLQFGTSDGKSLFDYSSPKRKLGVIEFELLKDLKRLEMAKDAESRVEILKRLFPLRDYWIDYEATVRNFISDPEVRAYLLNERKKVQEQATP